MYATLSTAPPIQISATNAVKIAAMLAAAGR